MGRQQALGAQYHTPVQQAFSAPRSFPRQLPRIPQNEPTWEQPISGDGRAPFGTGIYLNSLANTTKTNPKIYSNQNSVSPEHSSCTSYSNLNRRMSRSLNADDFNSLR